jgi:hypothetical protein
VKILKAACVILSFAFSLYSGITFGIVGRGCFAVCFI